jgi:hypothetical protein
LETQQSLFSPGINSTTSNHHHLARAAPISSQWEQSLFFGLQILDEQRLVAQWITGEIIYTNDGLAPDKASFEWAMTAPDGTRLATCFGPAWGFKPSSHQAAGCGMLSPLCFLIQFIKFFNIETPNSPQAFCDNKGRVDNVNSMAKHPDHFANDSLAADWDVVHEIVESRRQLAHPPSITHIKGHQDRDKPHEQLSLPA